MTTPEIQHLGTLLYEVRDRGAVVTLNRPDSMNTLGSTMKPDLARAFFELARNDDQVRAVLITGSGDKAVCAGADIKERATAVVRGTEHFVRQKATHELFRNIEEFE